MTWTTTMAVDSTLARMRRAVTAEIGLLLIALLAQAVLLTRLLHTATNYDEDVYLAAVDALRHGQSLGSHVFAAQFPGFYDLLRGLSYFTGLGVAALRAGMVAVTVAGTIGGWLIGRHFGGRIGGLLVAGLLVIAPPLDLFGYQVLADPAALALTALALGLATFPSAVAAIGAGVVFGGALSVKLTALTAAPALLWLLRRSLLPAATGFGIFLAVLLLAHVRALPDLWRSGVTYHERARSTPAVIPHPHQQILDQMPHTTPFVWLAVGAVAVGLAFFAMRKPLSVWPLWSWAVLAFIFLLVHKPLHYNHLIDFPFALAIATGATLGAALERGPKVLVAAVVLSVAAGYAQQLHRVDAARTTEPFSNVAAAAALEHLTAADALTVDDRPIISFLARRRVVGELVDLAFLRWETGSLTDARVIDDLSQAQAVVVSRALRSRPRILSYVRSHFSLRYDRGGVEIWTRT